VTQTPVEVFYRFKTSFSFVLLMTTVPGESGGYFDETNFAKIRRFKDLFPDKLVHVDGGVNEEISFILRTLGVYTAVSGSYLLRAKDVGKSLLTLKSSGAHLGYKVTSFMKKINEIAVIKENEVSLLTVLLRITESKMGFCLIVDDQGTLSGLITDGDIRRELVNNINDLSKMREVNFINRAPFTICDEDNIHEMLEKISLQGRNVNFVPVVSKSGRLSGAISFHNLIKGEL
jgi:ribulose-phosphate 3-epimerase